MAGICEISLEIRGDLGMLRAVAWLLDASTAKVAPGNETRHQPSGCLGPAQKLL